MKWWVNEKSNKSTNALARTRTHARQVNENIQNLIQKRALAKDRTRAQGRKQMKFTKSIGQGSNARKGGSRHAN